MSPVIGAILMVGITVILAAAIGAFVLDMGATAESAPQASLSISTDAEGDLLTLSHRGGDGLEATRIRLVITDAGGDRLALGPSPNASVLRVGGTVTVDLGGATVAAGPWEDMAVTGDGFDLETGDRLTVLVIDTEGQRVVLETRVTA